jgi:predicted porin
MKKNLLASSALAAAGALLASSAFAGSAPIEVKVKGYHQQWVGYGNQSNVNAVGEDVGDVDVQEDSEIHFVGSMVTDNGLTFGINVQLEGNTQNDTIDESYLFVRGEFGEIVLGTENGAAYAMSYGIPSAGAGIDSGDVCNWGAPGGCFELATTNGNFARRDNDSAKIRYISPRFSGFQVGASWAPEGTQDDDGFPTELSNNAGAGNEEGIASLAVNYDNTFGETRVRISGAYQAITDANGTSENGAYNTGVGVRVGFGGFTLSGAWNFMNDRSNTINYQHTYGLGLMYSSGMAAVSLSGVYADVNGWIANGGSDDKQLALELGGSYTLGPGVKAAGSLFYNDRDNGPGGNSTDGFAIVGGIALTF